MAAARRPLFAALPLLCVLFCAVTALAQAPGSAQALYRELRAVGLDPQRVYGVRDAALEREDLHIALEDGTIAFTRAVDGRVTGAFFEGAGEVLLIPPDRVERISLGLFTGAAILEEKFTSAYFRFNDDVAAELEPALRPAEDAPAFIASWSGPAEALAQGDALRLLASLLAVPDPHDKLGDHYLRARLGGTRLGTVDVFFDTRAPEQISVRQLTYKESAGYYDIWTSFPMRSLRRSGGATDPGDDVRIFSYTINSRVQPPTELESDARLRLEVLRGGQRVLFFELSRYLKAREVTADGKPLEFLQNEALEGSELARRGNDVVALVFPEPLRAGSKLELRFVYGGAVLSEAGGGLMYVGARGAWYPHRGPAMSDFELEFRYPAKWTLLATGRRLAFQTTGDEAVATWVSERPIPLAGFNLGQYARSVAQAGNVSVESYAGHGMENSFPKPRPTVTIRRLPAPDRPLTIFSGTPPPPAPAGYSEVVAQNSARTIEFLSRRLGPFPYSSLALTQMPGTSSHGWPGLVFLSSYAYLTPEERMQARLGRFDILLYGYLVQAHETAHQWWGDLLTWKSYRDQWLAEALANYCALLAMEKEHPAEFRQILDEYRDGLLQKDKEGNLVADAGPVALGVRLSSSRFPDGFNAISYGRGTWLFHMLRNLVRDPRRTKGDPDDAFYQALHTLVERFAGKALSVRDVQRAFEEVLPESARFEGRKSLDWFFDGWVGGIAVPRLELADVKFARRTATVASGTLRQKEAPDDLITAVPVYASVAGKPPVFVANVFADGAETPFRLTVPAGTRKLLLDPYQTVLTRP
jgi:hypothetical protein